MRKNSNCYSSTKTNLKFFFSAHLVGAKVSKDSVLSDKAGAVADDHCGLKVTPSRTTGVVSPISNRRDDLALSKSFLLHLPLEKFKEFFRIDAHGKIYSRKKAIAMLLGVTTSAINGLFYKVFNNFRVPNSLTSFAGKDFRYLRYLPEDLVKALVNYYATECSNEKIRNKASRFHHILATIGLKKCALVNQAMN